VSPKKTLEGFIGGIVTVLVLAAVAGIAAGSDYVMHTFGLSLIVALTGQAGDLAESLVKRERSVKDSSNIIPGHGGILDRFDSLFFAAPAAYAYIVLALNVCGGHS
jgi:phosphatidate cytidylyltransferase